MAAKDPTEKKQNTQQKSLVEQIDEELTCVICFSRFDKPKVLPCLHLYCEKCLGAMVAKARDKTKLSCPQCQEVHQVPAKGVSDFKTYFTINNLLELMKIHEAADNPDAKSSPKCTNCFDENKAMARCLTCSEYLCAECLASHKRTKSTFSHSILTLEEIMKSEKSAGLKSLTKKKFCQEHEEEVLKLYCKTCKEAICRDCTMIKHKTHEYVFVKDFRPDIQKELQELIEMVRAKEEEFKRQVQSLDEITTKNAATMKEHELMIQQNCQQLKEAIDKRCSVLQSSLKRTYDKEGKSLEAEKKTVSRALVRLSNGVKFTQQLLENGDDLEVVSMSTQASDTLRGLHEMAINETHKPVAITCHFKSAPITKQIQNFGGFSSQGVPIVDDAASKSAASKGPPALAPGIIPVWGPGPDPIAWAGPAKPKAKSNFKNKPSAE